MSRRDGARQPAVGPQLDSRRLRPRVDKAPSGRLFASGIGRGGTGVLKVDGKEITRQSMERSIPLILQWGENFEIGADTGTPVSDDYQVPFTFTGKFDKLTLKPANRIKSKELGFSKVSR